MSQHVARRLCRRAKDAARTLGLGLYLSPVAMPGTESLFGVDQRGERVITLQCTEDFYHYLRESGSIARLEWLLRAYSGAEARDEAPEVTVAPLELTVLGGCPRGD